jgi:hypothetical protein
MIKDAVAADADDGSRSRRARQALLVGVRLRPECSMIH